MTPACHTPPTRPRAARRAEGRPRRHRPVLVLLAGCLLLPAGAPASAAEPVRLAPVDPLAAPPPEGPAPTFRASTLAPDEKLAPALRERLGARRDSAPVRVIVTLAAPRAAAPATPSGTPDRRRARSVAALEHRFARAAAPLGFVAERGLAHFPVVIGSARPADLRRLAGLPEVEAIEDVVEVRAARVEGGGLVHAPPLRQLWGGDGAGVGVAIVDSGVDAEHPELLGRVTVEADLTGAGGSGAEDGNGHGTAVAGILAGTGGGMAPAASLWSLKVLDASGQGSADRILVALDTLYGQRNEHGGLRLINLSLVASAHKTFGPCDAVPFPPGRQFPAMAMILADLLEAGVTTFAASGNDAQPAVSFPACLSSTVAVGAVYDGDVGPKSFPGFCSDPTTRADQVACYSNSGAAVDLLAPSTCARTPAAGGGYVECFGGTSAATPYATGVAAQLLGLRPQTPPAELLAALAGTGLPVDLGQGITRNRIDALAAHRSLVAGDPGAPPPPAGPWLASPELPGFEAQVVLNDAIRGANEADCVAESLCVSGALPGRPEVFLKVIGPRPNGHLWVQVSRFTPSRVEIWLRRTATGEIRHYVLAAVSAGSDDVPGLQDREAFLP